MAQTVVINTAVGGYMRNNGNVSFSLEVTGCLNIQMFFHIFMLSTNVA